MNARFGRKLRHSNIVHLHGYHSGSGWPYTACRIYNMDQMDYVGPSDQQPEFRLCRKCRNAVTILISDSQETLDVWEEPS